MYVFYLFADPDRTTVFSTFTFGDSVKLLRLLPIRLIQHGSATAHIVTAHIATAHIATAHIATAHTGKHGRN